ncbi:unnamed protein product [Macrosiphum euphorbiae]|nr:unnamed protein product [Macrosiphum euphorbiae]
MSKEIRFVNVGNGAVVVGGFVNHCEKGLDNPNALVLVESKAVVPVSDQTVATINHRVYPPSSNELGKLKDLTLDNIMLLEEYSKSVALQNEKIIQLTNEVKLLKQRLRLASHGLPDAGDVAVRGENLDALPFTPVSSTCSSGMGDLSSAEIQDQQEQQEIQPKKRRLRQSAIKQPNPNPLESNQTKQPRTRMTRAKSAKIGKMQELSLVMADDAYYTCLGNYDPVKDEPVSKNTNSNLEIPSWRVKTYSSWYSMEGTENMSDDIFESRHYRLEQCEQKRKRWDMQRIRELKRIEYLKEGRNKHHSQKSNDNNKEELTTLLPSPLNIKAIEITDKLPVSAFGCNLHIKKKPEMYKFYHSQWYNDGSQAPNECNIDGLRSSGCSQFYDTM